MRSERDANAPAGIVDGTGAAAPSSRRKLLASLPALVAGSLPALALGAASQDELHQRTQVIIDRANAKGLPDTQVTTHTGERVLFHKDLVRDRVVLINFMSIGNEADYPVCANLSRLVQGLGECFGRDVFALSVTYDQANDTPERLAGFARQIGAPEGWQFVTASAEDVITVGYKLYRAQGRPRRQMDSDLIHYGNAGVGLWGTMSAYIADIPLAVSRVRSVMPAARASGAPRRAGPRRPEVAGPHYDHREHAGLA